MNKSFHIFSDVGYSGYQHVNQFLFRHISNADKNIECTFLSRFVMNYPNVKSVLVNMLSKYTGCKSLTQEFEPIYNSFENKVINIPPSNSWFDYFNSYIVSLQIPKKRDIAITFVPSRSLAKLHNSYNKLIYYCVHDSHNQRYPKFNRKYEMELSKKSSLVFCDNLVVLERLSEGQKKIDISNFCERELLIFQKNGIKFFYVPPPVPDVFFSDKDSSNTKFDFCYFGSIHSNIEQNVLEKICKEGFRLKVISSQKLNFEHENLYLDNPTTDMAVLKRKVDQCRAIVLPYDNSDFMSTISPAKIYQSLSFNLPVFCSNSKLTSEFKLLDIRNDMIIPTNSKKIVNNVYKYSCSKLMNKVTLLIKHSK
ncbi:hypothetical protein AB6D00_19445 [Vibrio cyclitrophicus]